MCSWRMEDEVINQWESKAQESLFLWVFNEMNSDPITILFQMVHIGRLINRTFNYFFHYIGFLIFIFYKLLVISMVTKTSLRGRNKNGIIIVNISRILKMDSVISALNTYSHLIFITTRRNRYYYYLLSATNWVLNRQSTLNHSTSNRQI